MVFYDRNYDLICEIKEKQIKELEEDLDNYKELYLKEKDKNIKLQKELNEIKNDKRYREYKEKITFNDLCNNQTNKLVEEIEKRL